MAFIRHRQPAITRLFPHQGNRRFLVPNRKWPDTPEELGPEQLIDPGITTLTNWRFTVGQGGSSINVGNPGNVVRVAGEGFSILQTDLTGAPADGNYRLTLGGFSLTGGSGPTVLLGGQSVLPGGLQNGVRSYLLTLSGASNAFLAFNAQSAADAWTLTGEVSLKEIL